MLFTIQIYINLPLLKRIMNLAKSFMNIFIASQCCKVTSHYHQQYSLHSSEKFSLMNLLSKGKAQTKG